MPRSGEHSRRRLQGAALELWSERGYDQTTTAEIAALAGVTPRTFFRHFPDKREVLFDSADAMRRVLTEALATTPAGMAPMKALERAFIALEPLFEHNRPYSGARRKVIAATPALRERELTKTAALTAALAQALAARGVEAGRATLAAQAATAAFGYAFTSWSEDATGRLEIHIARAFNELNALASAR